MNLPEVTGRVCLRGEDWSVERLFSLSAECGQLWRKVRECVGGGSAPGEGGNWGRGVAGGVRAGPKGEARETDQDGAQGRPFSSSLREKVLCSPLEAGEVRVCLGEGNRGAGDRLGEN